MNVSYRPNYPELICSSAGQRGKEENPQLEKYFFSTVLAYFMQLPGREVVKKQILAARKGTEGANNNKNKSTGSQALSFLRSKEKCTQFE